MSQIMGKFIEAKACECELPSSSVSKCKKIMNPRGEKIKNLIPSTINGMK